MPSHSSLNAANEILVRRQRKVLLDWTSPPKPATGGNAVQKQRLASLVKNLESLGYVPSRQLLESLRTTGPDQLTNLNQCLVGLLAKATGSHQSLKPFYPNFPEQVMAMSECELYLNALVHYLSEGRYKPPAKTGKIFGIFPRPKPRQPFTENPALKELDLGRRDQFETIFKNLALANSSLSEQDREDLTAFVKIYGPEIASILPPPDMIPQRENKAALTAALLRYSDPELGEKYARQACSTATDVLRLATALSGGDISLAQPSRFKTFSRRHRRLLLSLLENRQNIEEDLLRWKKPWIRLGEKLHPGEYKDRFPRAYGGFDLLRNDLPVTTFHSKLEKALAEKDSITALNLLQSRPGELARRLDHLLRLDATNANQIIEAFSKISADISTPVLLQVEHHFQTRLEPPPLRVFLPKGQIARAQCIAYDLPELPQAVCLKIALLCRQTLSSRFASLPPLGKCYLDPELGNFVVPFSQRSASKSLRTTSRGSRLRLPEADTLRFFVWWKNGKGRTDIDLSTAMFDENFVFVDSITYYNLRCEAGHHSGDIVDAPNGASEFIDISKSKAARLGIRYVVMLLNSFSQQPYCDLPECFAGWMSREKPNSGEVYEPKTVENKLDISADSKIAIPAIFDLVAKQVIWCDLTMAHNPQWHNNVAGNMRGIQITLRALAQNSKPNLYKLLKLHAEARGQLVENADEAETVFSAASLPFQLEKIAADFMA